MVGIILICLAYLAFNWFLEWLIHKLVKSFSSKRGVKK